MQNQIMPFGRAMKRDWLWLTLIAALGILMLVIQSMTVLKNFAPTDPDDMLRIVQVRNWLDGQSWFDVSQPRINPPEGGQMHWSRIVDIPIAVIAIAARPFVGAANAEFIAAATAPLLLFLVYILLMWSIARRLFADDRKATLMTLAVAVTIPMVVFQFAPLRVDHHGWQLLSSLALLRLALARPTLRTAVLSGFVMALHLSISLEGLPYVLIFGTLPALAYIFGRDDGRLLSATLGALTISAATLQLVTRGTVPFTERACDATTIPYLAAFAVAAMSFTVMRTASARWTARKGTLVARAAVLAVTGILTAVVAIAIAPHCLKGPFEELDPLVMDLWYANVSEGRPIWIQPLSNILLIAPTLLLGVTGSVIGWLNAKNDAQRRLWAILLFIGGAATLVAFMVLRASAVANAFSAPGAAVVVLAAWRWARARNSAGLRVITTILPIISMPIMATIGTQAVARQWSADVAKKYNDERVDFAKGGCLEANTYGALNRYPKGTILAPLDIGPAILLKTQHNVVATGHHRNAQAMYKALSAYTSTTVDAEKIIRSTGANMLVFCSRMSETNQFRKWAHDNHKPHALILDLDAGRVPNWLEPLSVSNDDPLKVYRIKAAGSNQQ